MCSDSLNILFFFEYEVLLTGGRSRKGGDKERERREEERGLGEERGRELPLQNSRGRAHYLGFHTTCFTRSIAIELVIFSGVMLP